MKDISGKKYHYLTAIKFIETRGRNAYWLFKCDCGNEHIARRSAVTGGRTKTCGCSSFIDYSGLRRGHLVAIKFLRRHDGRTYWLFLCDCGRKKEIEVGAVMSLNIKSCGCILSNRNHGFKGSPTYDTWSSMKGRCLNKKDNVYHRYGGRGICVCKRWLDFKNFLADMGERPKNMTLDRIDNDGNYEPSNCRWATPKDQSRNRSTNNLIKYLGVSKCITAWAEEYNINKATLRSRLVNGWPVDLAITKPVRKRMARDIL